MIDQSELVAASTRLFDVLVRHERRIVFAESCTAGLVSAALAVHPGVSDHHCGSAVVYRLDTKTKWLGVEATLLEDPGPVSEIVARRMAAGALDRTPEAAAAVSVTGHLGPNAPAALDGVVHIGAAIRITDSSPIPFHARRRLRSAGRRERQVEAAITVLTCAATWLDRE